MLGQLHRLADNRFGLLTRTDLEQHGLSLGRIARLVENGSLIRVHRAVYRLPGSRRSIEQDALAACMAIGPHAVASHLTAGRVWAITDKSAKPEVTVPRTHRSAQATVVVHRSIHFGRDEITRKGPIPVTRVARTIADLASCLSGDDLEEALDEALRRRLVTPDQLARYGPLRRLAEDRRDGIPGSDLERKAIKALRNAGLPKPLRQHNVGRYRIDLAYPGHHLAIELEGRAPHWGRGRWQSDHDRRNALELLGWRVLTFTWQDVTDGSLDFVAKVGQALRLRPTRWRSAAR